MAAHQTRGAPSSRIDDAQLERLARVVVALNRQIARLVDELRRNAGEAAGALSADREAIRQREAVLALLRIQQLFELSLTDLGRVFGTSRQAASSWLRRGVPPSRTPKLFTVLNVGELLERKLKAGRLPAVVRRAAPAYDGLSMLQMIEADRHEELLEKVRESFDWAATA